MKTLEIYSLGELPVFDRLTSDPNYWSERVYYEISHMLHSASVAGMTYNQPEESDLTASDTELTNFLGDFEEWVGAVADQQKTLTPEEYQTAIMPTLPAIIIPETLKLVLKGAGQYALVAVIKTAIELAVKWTGKKIEKKIGITPAEDVIEHISESLEIMAFQTETLIFPNMRITPSTGVIDYEGTDVP